jgi:hypothetical protein
MAQLFDKQGIEHKRDEVTDRTLVFTTEESTQ